MQLFLTLYICSTQPNQTPSKLFCGYWQTASKIYMERQRPRIANLTLKEKTEATGQTLLNFKAYCKATLIKTVWYCKRVQIDQWNRTHINAINWSLTKEQRHYNGARMAFSKSGAGMNEHPHAKKNLGIDITPFTHWLKMSDRYKCKMQNCRTRRQHRRRKSRWPGVWWWLSRHNTKDTSHEKNSW